VGPQLSWSTSPDVKIVFESWSWSEYFNRTAPRTEAVYQRGQYRLEVLSCEPGGLSKREAIRVGHPGLELVDSTGGSPIRRCLNEGHMEGAAGRKRSTSAYDRSQQGKGLGVSSARTHPLSWLTCQRLQCVPYQILCERHFVAVLGERSGTVDGKATSFSSE